MGTPRIRSSSRAVTTWTWPSGRPSGRRPATSRCRCRTPNVPGSLCSRANVSTSAANSSKVCLRSLIFCSNTVLYGRIVHSLSPVRDRDASSASRAQVVALILRLRQAEVSVTRAAELRRLESTASARSHVSHQLRAATERNQTVDAPAEMCPRAATASPEMAKTNGAAGWSLPTSGRGAVVPYIAAWSGEEDPSMRIVGRGLSSGIGFADETVSDRDERGVLWSRTISQPGEGRPLFGQVHSSRQRRAMRRLLCQVCAKQADRNEQGVLWLLVDHRDDWPGWPENMANSYPPMCLSCARLSIRACPTLRRGYVAVRTRRAPLSGVYGVRYLPARRFPVPAGGVVVGYDDPAVLWVCAVQQVRSLQGCTIITLDPVD